MAKSKAAAVDELGLPLAELVIGDNSKRQSGKGLDSNSDALIYDGANLSQLCMIFRMERRLASPKLRNVAPCGERGGYPIYHIHEAAPWLVKPAYDVETYLKRMHHNELPKLLTKEYWNGAKAKQDYLIRAGELWDTNQVLRVAGEAIKTLRMSLLLSVDSIDRMQAIPQETRDLLRQLVDQALNDAANCLVEAFGERAATEIRDLENDI